MAKDSIIPVAGPSITQLEIDYVKDAVSQCWYGEANKYHELFEGAFAEYVGSKFAVSLPSCTSGLHLSLAALGVKDGDEVIVPDITWIASAAPISYVGAKPVFCDVDFETWCMDSDSLESCISPDTKAIIAVDLYGGMPDWTALQAVADRHGIPIIEDAAEAIGSEYGGRKAGSFGRTGVFSFHGSKTITTGEGGMLVTDDSDLFDRIMFLRDHGRVPGDLSFRNEEVAYKYKMSSMQAALGLAQIQRVEELVSKKREIFSRYEKLLAAHSSLTLNAEPEGVRNSYWMSSVLVADSVECPKLDLIAELRERYNIDTRPFFSPLSNIPAYENSNEAKLARRRNQVSQRLSRQGINLPSALCIENEEIDYTVDSLLSCLNAR